MFFSFEFHALFHVFFLPFKLHPPPSSPFRAGRSPSFFFAQPSADLWTGGPVSGANEEDATNSSFTPCSFLFLQWHGR